MHGTKGNNCQLKIGDDEVALTSYTAPPSKVSAVTMNTADTVSFQLINNHGLTGAIIFVAKPASGDPVVVTHTDAASVTTTDAQNVSGADDLEDVAYTVWIRHSAGIEKKSVTASGQ